MNSPSQETLDNLQHRIALNEALLASLEGDDTEDSRRDIVTIQHKLHDLKAELRSHISIPNWGGTAKMASGPADRPGSSSSEGYGALTPEVHGALTPASDAGSMAPPDLLALPSRKRRRNSTDYDDDVGYPDSKSLRPSPAISSAPSPASTTDSYDFAFDDDPVMQQIFGANAKEDMKENKRYLNELEKKRKQEKEDENFARQLMESENIGLPSASSGYRPASSNYTQATFRPDASSYRTMLPPAAPSKHVKPEPPAYPSNTGYPAYAFPSSYSAPSPYSVSSSYAAPTPYGKSSASIGAPLPPSWQIPTQMGKPAILSLTDSDDSEIEEISASDFNPNARQQQRTGNNEYGFQLAGQPQNLPFASSQTMPGAFPGASFAGNSVYGGNPALPSFPGFDSDLASLGFLTGSGMAGSSMDPLDLDLFRGRHQDPWSDPAKTRQELEALIQHIRPDEDLRPEDRGGTPEQIKFPLMEHQKLGLTWMKMQEVGTNKGGILADDMGLGKTIQALSLIVSRPPPPGVRRPTLVVAPVALMEQWKREAEKMVKPQYALKVFILHGSTRQTSWNLLKTYDIILTTYGQLASDLKRKLAWEEKLKMYPDARPTIAEYSPILGDQSKFHRVILDEAQWIKNKSTKSAIAACYIQSEYRWCMTGTPMQNKVDELYSLIKFCRIKPYNEDAKFSRDFSRPLKSTYQAGKDKAMRQLQALLKAILLRRTKTSTIDGKPILTLPPKTMSEARAVFSEDERDFYKALEGKAQLQFNRYMKAGTVGRNYSNVLVLLLRLRQACCHPHLIKDFAVHTGATMEGVDLLENARTLSKEVVARIKAMEGAFECPVCLDAAENAVIFNPCGHALCNECLASLVDTMTQAGEGSEPACPHCRAKINTSKVTDHNSFLKVFSPELLPKDTPGKVEDEEATASESDSDDSSEDDDDSGDDGEDLKDFIVKDEDDIEDDEDEDDLGHGVKRTPLDNHARVPNGKQAIKPEDDDYALGRTPFEKSASTSKFKKRRKPKKSKKGKGKEKAEDNHKSLAQLRREGLRNKAAKKKYLKRLKKDWQTSAKIEKTLELLEAIHARGTNDKTIIFSGFTSFLDLLEVPLHRHPDLSNYARYDGSMPPKSRNEAVLEFTGNLHCKVMLVSLKAGNAGLNLTAASQVIILDPHWNPFVEMQAADRAYRIGQMKEVEVHRVLIDGQGMDANEDGSATVEDRILALQEKKRQLVESALDEAAGNTVARLGIAELGFLFVSTSGHMPLVISANNQQGVTGMNGQANGTNGA